jgi:parallel beta-helix repeat protein
MKAPVLALVALVALSLSACSEDESPTAPNVPAPVTDRYVDAATGDDTNPGTGAAPWATLTHAVSAADEGVTIRVAPGTYSAGGGETFPITMKARQVLLGDVASKGAGAAETRIQGEGVYALEQLEGAAIVGAEGARIAGFVIANETNPLFYVGVAVDGVAMEIDNNTFPGPMYAGVNSGNGAGPDVHDNVFTTSTYGLFMDRSVGARVHNNDIATNSTGIRIHQATGCVVESNTIRGIQIGVSVQDLGDPTTIRNNNFIPTGDYIFGAIDALAGSPVIRNNTFSEGPALWVRSSGAPNMGTAGDAGGNNMTAIAGTVIQHDGTGTATALGNDWPNEPPVAGDIVITSTGTVLTEW